MESFSLYELNEYIRRVVALNFQEAIWVHAEISQIKESKGQYYLDLIEKDESTETVKALSSAVIWYRSFLFIKKKLGELTDSLLKAGVEIRVKVKVDFHERYGLKLVIEDIDPKFTLGQLEIRRQQIVDRLEKEKLLDLNEQLSLPSAMQNIAIISSSTAAGYIDFITQLDQNPYGYDFTLELFNVAVQGHKVKYDVPKAIKEISEDGSYDCILIMRGGGSKLDLSAFDDYDIGITIAQAPIPVICGIGHQIDNTIADLVCHTSVKTPTALADFLIDHNVTFETAVIQLEEIILSIAAQRLREEEILLNQIEASILANVNLKMSHHNNEINLLEERINFLSKSFVDKQVQKLQTLEQIIELLNPKKILSRGYAMVRQNKKVIEHISNIQLEKTITIEMKNGTIEATPNSIKTT